MFLCARLGGGFTVEDLYARVLYGNLVRGGRGNTLRLNRDRIRG